MTSAQVEEQLLEELTATREQLRDDARAKLGVTGHDSIEKFGAVRRRLGVSYYPIVALGLLAAADEFQSFAFTVLTPEISRSLGIGVGAIAGCRALQLLFTMVAPLPIAALSQHKSRRAMLCIATGLGWSVMTLFTGFVTSVLGLIAVLCLDGFSTGSVTALHSPLIMDSYPPEVRVRALSRYGSGRYLGQVASPLLVALLASILGFTWRGVFIALGLTSTAMTLFALRLKDPGYGKWDTQQLRTSVHDLHGEAAQLAPEEVALGFWEICHRLLMIPTSRRIYAGFLVFGLLSVPLGTFESFFLDTRWGLGPGGRGVFFGFVSAMIVVSLVLYGGRAERLFRQGPAKLLRLTAGLLALSVTLIALGGLSPWFAGMVACFASAAVCIGLLLPSLGVCMLSVIPSVMRPHAQAIVGICVAIGGALGALFLGGIQSRFGIGGAMVAVAFPGVLGAFIIGTAGKFIAADLDRMIDDVLEDEEIKRISASGGRLPMLACRGIDFSYGQLQVLFNVDFTVDDGEMVALLGTNGAGKSTLLKVVSGIGLPTAGTIRFRGQEITYLDAERRLRLGIAQIPGGRAVFGPMTVVDNFRSFACTLGSDRKAIDAAIERCFEAFPRLYERRNSNAATLSGGEQQMLGLSKALILRPKLLVIDELSLGLAPVIVGQLLEMVRQINREGTAVVLVEQSVNIALNLVDHAYFMEKGEMRFDGRSDDLLARDDLLRAVFLHGAAAGASA